MCDGKDCSCGQVELIQGDFIRTNYDTELLNALCTTLDTLYSWDVMPEGLDSEIVGKICRIVGEINLD